MANGGTWGFGNAITIGSPGWSTYSFENTGELPRRGFGELLPEPAGADPEILLIFDPADPATFPICRLSSRPADRWKRDNRLTTLVDVWVLTPTGPPYGVMGNIWVVPLNVDTATHRESGLNAMSYNM